jgi:hypothetical protein
MKADSLLERDRKEHIFNGGVERYALLAALIASLVQAAVVLLFTRNDTLPLVGAPNSVASQALIGAVIVALAVSPLAYLRGAQFRSRRLQLERRHDFRWAVAPITLASALVAALVVMGTMEFLNRAFIGVVLSKSLIALFLGFSAGVIAYIISNWIAHLHSTGLIYLAIGALFGTLLFAGVRNEDPLWWTYSFSHLGMTESNSRRIFDIGLLFTGLLILVWQQFIMSDIIVLQNHGLITARVRRYIRISLVVVAIATALVGVVRFGISPFFNIVHDLSAVSMGVAAGLLLISMPWTMPFHARSFYVLSYVILAAMLLILPLKIMNVVNVTGMEMFEFMLAGSWLVLFARNTVLAAERVADIGPEPVSKQRAATKSKAAPATKRAR